MHRLASWPWSRQLQGLGTPAQGRVVRNGQLEAEQMYNGSDQPLGLAQGQAKYRTQCQRRGDRQIGVGGLPAPGGARLGPPGRNRCVCEPVREPAALAKGPIIRCPLRHSMLLLWNVAAA